MKPYLILKLLVFFNISYLCDIRHLLLYRYFFLPSYDSFLPLFDFSHILFEV